MQEDYHELQSETISQLLLKRKRRLWGQLYLQQCLQAMATGNPCLKSFRIHLGGGHVHIESYRSFY